MWSLTVSAAAASQACTSGSTAAANVEPSAEFFADWSEGLLSTPPIWPVFHA